MKSNHHLLKLTLLFRVSEHVKNYRPKLLLFSGPPSSRPSLVHFANLITKRISLLSTTHIVKVMMVMMVMVVMMLLSTTHIFKEMMAMVVMMMMMMMMMMLLSTIHIVKVMVVMMLMMLLSTTHIVKEKDIDWPEVDALRTSAQEWCLRNKVDF